MEKKDRRGSIVVGLVLVLVGVVAFASQYFEIDGGQWGSLIVLGLGVVFLLAGMVTGEFGYFVPGGILTGIGAGIALIAGPWQERIAMDDGGVFLLAFAGGWFLITIFGLIFTHQFHWWPLIPGGIIGLVGLALAFGGVMWNVVEWLGYLWPLALIAAGIYIVYRAYTGREKQVDDAPIEKHV